MDRWLELSNGHKVWTKTVGDGPGLPLLLLHGGPGPSPTVFVQTL